MAARSIASLTLGFGLVSIPVKLYSATESSSTVRFNLLAKDGSRVKQQYVSEKEGKVVEHLASVVPNRFSAKSGAQNRVGKVFVDYIRNTHGATTAAAYSARARPGLGVSMPVSWDQLKGLKSGAQWTIANAREHLSFQKADPWADYWTARQPLARAMKRLGYNSAEPA